MENSPKAVDAIGVFGADGSLRPLRIQFQDENRQMIRVNIESVVKCETVKVVGAEAIIYLCKANLWGNKCIFELKYSIRDHSWSLLRRVH